MANILDDLAFQARFEVGRNAVVTAKYRLTFEALWQAVQRNASFLRARGVTAQKLVLTWIDESDVDYIVTLALFHIGAVTCSNQATTKVDALDGVDFIVTTKGGAGLDFPNVIELSAAQAVKGPDDSAAPAPESPEPFSYADDSPCRIVLTSGTTGARKAVPLAWRQIYGRVRHSMQINVSVAHFYQSLRFSSGPGFLSAMTSILTGVPYYYAAEPAGALGLVSRHRISLLIGSPLQLSQICDVARQNGVKLPYLRAVRLTGGAPGKNLLALIAETLSPNIYNVYGSTEAGLTGLEKIPTDRPEHVAFAILPGHRVEIVDPEGRIAAHGEEGRIRIKGLYASAGYWGSGHDPGDPGDGWFYPGDLGRMDSGGALVVLGRDADSINRGGIKINALLLDDYLAGLDDVDDAAVFPFENESGVVDLAAALVCKNHDRAAEYAKAVSAEFGSPRTPSRFVFVRRIPRNENGKIVRSALTKALERRIAAKSAAV